jgi:hypothetical protein
MSMTRKDRMPMFITLGMLFLVLLPEVPHAADYVYPDTIGVIATRNLQDSLLGCADTIAVTVSLSNTEPDSLRNLYFADHVPEPFFDIFTEEVQVNGTVLADTEYVYEVGLADEVYAGTVPHRWVIEVPPDSLGNRSCSQILDPSSGTLQIVYTARCTTGGTHYLPSYTWAGQLTSGDLMETFGYTDSVSITITDLPPEVDDLMSVLSGSGVLLFWSPPGEEVDHYVVYRDSFPGFDSGGGDSLGIAADTFYVDDVAGGVGDPGLNWYYVVRAVDVLGKKSDDSNCAGEFDKDLGNLK